MLSANMVSVLVRVGSGKTSAKNTTWTLKTITYIYSKDTWYSCIYFTFTRKHIRYIMYTELCVV